MNIEDQLGPESVCEFMIASNENELCWINLSKLGVFANNKQSGLQPSYNSLATHHGLRPSHSPRLSHDGHDGYGCARGASLEQSFSIVRPVLQVPDVVLARGHP